MMTNNVSKEGAVLCMSTIRSDQNRIPPTDYSILVYVLEAYGFLIDNRETLSFPEFAARIVNCYDVSNPTNGAVVATLNKYPPMEAI